MRNKKQVGFSLDPGQKRKLDEVAAVTKIPMSVLIGDFADYLEALLNPSNYRRVMYQAANGRLKAVGETVSAVRKAGAGFAIHPHQKERLDRAAETLNTSRGALIGDFADWLGALKEPTDYKLHLFQAIRIEVLTQRT